MKWDSYRLSSSSRDLCTLGLGAALGVEVPFQFTFLGAFACLMAHSLATCWNCTGSFINILATSASCGSLGSGVLRRDWRERRADLIVRTGDQAEPRVSRQIAPCAY